MSAAVEQVRHPVAAAVASVREQLGSVAEMPLWSLRPVEVEQALVAAHAAAAQLAELMARLTAEADRQDLAGTAGAPNTRAWLRNRLRLSPGAAKRQQLLGAALDHECAATRAALADGVIDVDQAQVITRTMADLPAAVAPDLRSDVEVRMVAEAGSFDASVLAQLGQRILEIVDPDGADARLGAELAREEARNARREVTFSPDLDGMIALRGRLAAEAAGIVQAALDPLAAPRCSDANGPDVRSPGQRNADALVELARRQLAAGELPVNGGDKPHLVVTIDHQSLVSRLGAAQLDTAAQISAAAARRLACDATIIPAVLGSTSQPLDLGRSVRLVSGALRRALVLRDRGCAFPGCDRPPTWCDGHHIRFWADGGSTSLTNTVLLCGYHHSLVHKGDWTVVMAHDGHPDFLPPPWIDPDRKPLRNTLHRRL